MTEDAKKPAPKKPKIRVEVPKNMPTIYANSAIVRSTASEMILDLAQMMPESPVYQIQGRVIMTPLNAKLLLRALSENVKRFEAAHGEIKLPAGHSNLAEQLFRPPPSDDEDDEKS